jgi:hypothetical protein
MIVKKIVKRFLFYETNRSEIELGTDTRLNPSDNCIQLLYNESTKEYPTDSDLYVKSWVFNPGSVVRFIGFDVLGDITKDYDNTELTGYNFRIGNGTNEYYWNGATWEINTTDWNTEDEIAENINSFDATEKKLQIIINLTSNDIRYTPKIYEIRVLYESTIDFQDDLIYNSIIPKLKELRPISDHIIVMPNDSDTIDLNDFELDTDYEIIAIDSCFNYTDDPSKYTDIYSSYDSNTKIITLNTTVSEDKKVWIKFTYKPLVAFTTDDDYIEVSKVPAIHILNTEVLKNIPASFKTSVRNKFNYTATSIIKSRQRDYEFIVSVITNSSFDLQRLQDSIQKLFEENEKLNLVGLDESYNWFISSDFTGQGGKNSGVFSSIFRFLVKNIVFSYSDETNELVQSFNIAGDLSITII